MNLYILGKNTTDKGSQLEKLTSKLLQDLGFKNIIKNEISNGGHEIDLRAEYIVSSLDGDNIKPLICECKAYKNPVQMTDWLKFLGKVLIEEHKGNIDAYFIALNGVNGNVSGNYRDLLQLKRNNIKLITGETLIKQLQKNFKIVPINEVHEIVEQMTHRKPIEICFAYYNLQIVYLIGFSENEYSLLSNNGEQIKSQKVISLFSDLISSNTTYSEYINLESENKGIERQKNIKRYLIARLLYIKKGETKTQLQNFLKTYDESFQNLTAFEIINSLNDLINESIIIKNGEKYNLTIISEKINSDKISNFYKLLLNGFVPEFVFGCEYYDKFIDEKLLNYICKIQGDISIPKDKINEILHVLRLSPSALLRALHPDEMIINHRTKGLTNDLIDEEDTKYFLQNSGMLLAYDFKNLNFSEYFYNIRNILELETNNSITLKSKKKAEFSLEFKERLLIGKMGEDYNNQFVLIRVFNNQPEPWEQENK